MGSVGQYTQGWFPWVAHKSSVGTPTREPNSLFLGMGYLNLPDAQNNEFVCPAYMDSVTWKVAANGSKGPGEGIATFIFDATTIGTIDRYAAAYTENNYSEITGYAQATPKAADVTMRAATKNASSTGFRLQTTSIALIRTGGTPSTPGGTDTPGYTHELVAFMGTKTNTNFATRSQASTELAGGRLDTDSTAQNNLFTYDMWRDTGTFKVALVHRTGTDRGIYNVTGFSGMQTVDGYADPAASNTYTEVTGITSSTADVATVQVSMATKNASSSAFGGSLNSIKWLRTGA